MNIIVNRDGGAQHKLSIARDRIELKLKEDVDEVGEKWLISFAELVVSVALPLATQTIRGRIRPNKIAHVPGVTCYSIMLYYSNRVMVEGTYFCSCRMELPAARGNV